MADKPQQNLVRKALSIKIWGMDASLRPFNDTVKTLQIAPDAVEIECPRQLVLGEIVGIGFNQQKGRFRVAQSFIANSDMYRILLESVGTGCMWERELSSPDPEQADRKERRRDPRLPVTGAALLLNADGSPGSTARLVDVSRTGCYMEIYAPASPGTALQFRITAEGITASVHGVVRTMHPHIGMGVEIVGYLTVEDQQRFEGLVTLLQQQQKTT